MQPIESVAAVAAVQSSIAAEGAMAGTAQSASAPEVFANLIQRQIADLNASVSTAETAVHDLASGKSVELHEVMISLERARLSVQTFVQVRNRLIESYQDLMRMQL